METCPGAAGLESARRSPALPLGHIDLASRSEALQPTARKISSHPELPQPLAVVNIATTGGWRRSDRIAALLCVLLPAPGQVLLFLETVDPAAPIRPDGPAAHGLTRKDVAHSPAFEEIAAPLAKRLAGYHVAGLHPEGDDLMLLRQHFSLAGVHAPLTNTRVDLQHVLPDHEFRQLEMALRFDCGRTVDCACGGGDGGRRACCFGRLARCPGRPSPGAPGRSGRPGSVPRAAPRVRATCPARLTRHAPSTFG